MKRISIIFTLATLSSLAWKLVLWDSALIAALLAIIPAYTSVWCLDSWTYEKSGITTGNKTNILPLYLDRRTALALFAGVYAAYYLLFLLL